MPILPKPRVPRDDSLQARCPMLAESGLAVEHFPHYVNRAYRPHAVPVVLLSYIVRGHGRHVMGDHVFEEHGGSLAVTHYGQQHDIVTDADGMEIYNLYLDLAGHDLPSLPAEFRDLLPNILPLHPTFQNLLNRRVRLVFDDPAPITALFRQMHRESVSREAGAAEVLRACLRILLIECCRQARRSGIRPGIDDRTPAVAWLERLRRHIDAHFTGTLTLRTLARVAGVNPSYLSRAFHRYTGKTLIAYLTERRLQAALVLLRSTDDKVLTIAMNCGFRDPAHFNRIFKRALGQPPTAFRRPAVARSRQGGKP